MTDHDDLPDPAEAWSQAARQTACVLEIAGHVAELLDGPLDGDCWQHACQAADAMYRVVTEAMNAIIVAGGSPFPGEAACPDTVAEIIALRPGYPPAGPVPPLGRDEVLRRLAAPPDGPS